MGNDFRDQKNGAGGRAKAGPKKNVPATPAGPPPLPASAKSIDALGKGETAIYDPNVKTGDLAPQVVDDDADAHPTLLNGRAEDYLDDPEIQKDAPVPTQALEAVWTKPRTPKTTTRPPTSKHGNTPVPRLTPAPHAKGNTPPPKLTKNATPVPRISTPPPAPVDDEPDEVEEDATAGGPKDALAIGASLVDGRFVIEAHAGEGLESIVYRAMDRHENRRCALKEFSGDALVMMDALRKSLEDYEGPIPGSIAHKNVVEIYELVHDWTRGPILVMEYVAGGTLDALIQRKNRLLGPLEAAKVYAPIADAIATAHENGIFVGDVHPRQIMVGAGGSEPKLDATAALIAHNAADLADWLDRRQRDDLPPELLAAEPQVTSATDVYAIGAALSQAMYAKPAVETAKSLRSLSRGARPIFEKCLAQRTSDRYSSADQVAEALKRLGDNRSWLSPQIASPPVLIAVLAVVAVIGILLAGLVITKNSGPVVPIVLNKCPPDSELEMVRASVARNDDLQAMKQYRELQARFPECMAFAVPLAQLSELESIRTLRRDHKKKLLEVRAAPGGLTSDQRREIGESVGVLRIIDPNDEQVRYWGDQLRSE